LTRAAALSVNRTFAGHTIRPLIQKWAKSVSGQNLEKMGLRTGRAQRGVKPLRG
jgi:hypothetical protein